MHVREGSMYLSVSAVCVGIFVDAAPSVPISAVSWGGGHLATR